MVDCARELFVTEGYAATTMDRIADDAGVAVQTLCSTFRTKGRMLCEVVERTAAGDDDAVAAALAVEHGTDIFARAAPLWPAVTAAAAADPQVELYWRGVAANRRAGQKRMVARLTELEALRDGLPPDRATDLAAAAGCSHRALRPLLRQPREHVGRPRPL